MTACIHVDQKQSVTRVRFAPARPGWQLCYDWRWRVCLHVWTDSPWQLVSGNYFDACSLLGPEQPTSTTVLLQPFKGSVCCMHPTPTPSSAFKNCMSCSNSNSCLGKLFLHYISMSIGLTAAFGKAFLNIPSKQQKAAHC